MMNMDEPKVSSQLRQRRTHNNNSNNNNHHHHRKSVDNERFDDDEIRRTIIMVQKDDATRPPAARTPSMGRNAWSQYQHYIFLYLILCLIRIFMTHFLIHSYFDPDEFWQTLEPSYCVVFFGRNNNHSNSINSSNPTNDHDGFITTTTTTNTNLNPYACQGITWEWTVRDTVPPPLSSSSISSSSSSLRFEWLQQSYIAIGPIRSYLGLLPTIFFYQLLQYIQWDTTFFIARGPLYLHVCCITVPIDVCTYYLVTLFYNHHHHQSKTTLYGSWYLFITLSSWFVVYAFTRTFANTYETLFFVVALVLVSPELFIVPNNDTDDDDTDDDDNHHLHSTDRSTITTTTTSTSIHTTKHQNHEYQYRWIRTGLAFVLGGCSIAIRITAVASFVPLGILLAIQQPYMFHVTKHNNRSSNDCSSSNASTSAASTSSSLLQIYYFIRYLFHPCATFGIIGILIASSTDWYNNGFVSIPILSNLYFNVIMDYASLYGAHVWYWYYIHGLVTICGLLYPILIYAFISDFVQWTQYVFRKNKSNQFERIPPILWNRFMIWILFVSYIYVVSWNDHKEFRFISPILPLVFILSTPHVHDLFHTIGTTTTSTTGSTSTANRSIRKRNMVWYLLGFIWIIANLVAVMYLGLFHQSGPVSVHPAIISLAKQNAYSEYLTKTSDSLRVFSIHYLTGACHSTPLQSHLHIPIWDKHNTAGSIIKFDTWHLNCHPHCRVEAKRTEGSIQCETDQFDTDPISFIQRAYCVNDKNEYRSLNETQNCRSIPDFMVTFSHYLTKEVLDMLQHKPYCLQLDDEYRFPNHLRGIQLQGFGTKTYQFGDGHWSNVTTTAATTTNHQGDGNDNNDLLVDHEQRVYIYQTILPGILEVNSDAVILLYRIGEQFCRER